MFYRISLPKYSEYNQKVLYPLKAQLLLALQGAENQKNLFILRLSKTSQTIHKKFNRRRIVQMTKSSEKHENIQNL